MFSNKHFKKILNILLLLLIFLSLACYYFAECKSPVAVVEGAGGKKKKRRRRRRRRRRRKIKRRRRKIKRRRRNKVAAIATKATTAMKELHRAAQQKMAQQLVKNAAIAKAAAARLAVKEAATKAAKIAAQAKADAAIKKAQEAARKEAEKARIAAAAAAKAARIEAERIAAAAKAAIIEAERIAAAKRALEEKHKMVQENIHAELVKGVSTGEGISNCAVAYGDNLQLGKNAGLFSIFGNNDILKCNKDGIPEFVPAKQKEINNDGIYLLNQNKNNASGQVMYGDTVSLCNKNYTISGKDSNTKVKYGGNITMTPTTVNKNSSVIHATVNPNVYSLPNVMNLNSADYSTEYVKKYQYCGNSGGNNDGLAKR